MAELFANGASALVVANVSPVDTVVQVENGLGGAFPSPSSPDFARLVIERDDALFEVVYLTSKTADLLTLTRAQEGTTALAFTAGLARIELRPTKGMLESFLQKSGGTMTGALNLGSQALTNAAIASSTMTGGRTIGTSIRASDDSTANQISVPAGGGAPTIGGQAIWHAGTLSVASLFPTGMVMMWYGSQGSIPSGWALCNGASGTPDLRDKFVIGAGNSYSLSATGGALTGAGTAASGGAHTHTVGDTALTTGQLAAHTHSPITVQGSSDDNGFAGPLVLTQSLASIGDQVLTGASTGSAGSGETHTHTLTSDGAHTHTVSVDTTPPYYALFFIMKL